ncbi:MAG: hypothetical protein SFV32_12855 [Opitutaceae bacterium]|nr:hypothetical protein [Opitutaceae bacterium]
MNLEDTILQVERALSNVESDLIQCSAAEPQYMVVVSIRTGDQAGETQLFLGKWDYGMRYKPASLVDDSLQLVSLFNHATAKHACARAMIEGADGLGVCHAEVRSRRVELLIRAARYLQMLRELRRCAQTYPATCR